MGRYKPPYRGLRLIFISCEPPPVEMTGGNHLNYLSDDDQIVVYKEKTTNTLAGYLLCVLDLDE
jgi:hypothetical protein